MVLYIRYIMPFSPSQKQEAKEKTLQVEQLLTFCGSDVVLVEIWRQSGVWPPLRIRGSHVDYWNIQYSGAADRADVSSQAQGRATATVIPVST